MSPKITKYFPNSLEKHCRRAKKKKKLNFVSLSPCVYVCVYLLGALYALPPVCVLHASLGWVFFPFFFNFFKIFFFFTPVEMRNLFYVEKTSRMALDVDQM